jgi:hypothetical protein
MGSQRYGFQHRKRDAGQKSKSVMTDHTDVNLPGRPERDLRLDLLRGIGQWMVFLDHIPYDIVGWLTIRNYGFSDATEFFVFISGYCAGYIYGPAVRRGQFTAVTKRLFRRAWQLYLAHIFILLLFTAQVARSARHVDSPMYEHEFNVFQFLQHPDVMIEQALTLRFKPVNLDVLPLFIVFMLASPFMLWALTRRPNWCLFGSVALYFLARWFGWNLPSFPQGTWYFNPFAWQLMFVFGAWCACGGGLRLQSVIRSRTVTVLAAAMLVFAFWIAMTWHFPSLGRFTPNWLHHVLYPMGKPNMDPPRVVHFLAALVLIARFLPRQSAELSSRVLRPFILCGQHSLPIFCFGVLLSFAAHWFLVQVAGGDIAQILVSIAGIVLMVAAAWLMAWYKNLPELFAVPKAAPASQLTN